MSVFRYKVLIADKDVESQAYIKKHLSERGFDVLNCNSAKDAIEIIYSHMPDVILLDLNLSDGDGSYVISSVRKWTKIPIIVVTQRGGERDVVNAFNLGCDDYVVKPVRINELTARINCALRHTLTVNPNGEISVSQRITVADMTVDFLKHRVYICDNNLTLTPNEFRIIALLAKNVGRVVEYRQIIHELWGPTASIDTKILRVHMANVRKKIAVYDKLNRYVYTEAGIGYMLNDK
ncbi:MAG: response regulator transcription factor [Christensenellaceae bacterium]